MQYFPLFYDYQNLLCKVKILKTSRVYMINAICCFFGFFCFVSNYYLIIYGHIGQRGNINH